MTRLIVALVALVAVACGGDQAVTLDSVIESEQCEVAANNQKALFSSDEVHCEDGTVISWHATESDQASYRAFLSELLGLEPDVEGPNYLVYRG
jgi:hypothetical protein